MISNDELLDNLRMASDKLAYSREQHEALVETITRMKAHPQTTYQDVIACEQKCNQLERSVERWERRYADCRTAVLERMQPCTCS